MRSFEEFVLSESKNTHLTHLEDLILIHGAEGVTRSVAFLDSIIRMLAPDLKESKITLKWDGAPAIFAGINPENGKFFVGTKSIFAKTNPKLNYTPADIDANHGGSGELPDKLKAALKYLPSIWKKGVFQGDMMFTQNSKQKKKVNGEDHVVFRPNTITYAVQADSDVGKRMLKSKFGIVFHTRYSGGKSVADMKASFDVSTSDFKQSPTVWFDDAEFKDISDVATFSNSEAQAALKGVNALRKRMINVRGSIKKLFNTNKKHIPVLIIYNNSQIRSGDNIPNSKKHFDNFVNWYVDREYKRLKTFNDQKEAALRKDLEKNKAEYLRVFDFYSDLRDLKKIIIKKLNQIKKMKTFLQTEKGFKVVGHEGFVAISRSGSSIKLVDRMEFSRNNFTTDKGWSK